MIPQSNRYSHPAVSGTVSNNKSLYRRRGGMQVAEEEPPQQGGIKRWFALGGMVQSLLVLNIS